MSTKIGLDLLGNFVPLPPAVAPTTSIGASGEESSWFKETLAGIAGGGLGYYFFKGKHPVLGVLGGLSVGSNAYRIVTGQGVKDSLLRVGRMGAGILSSKYLTKYLPKFIPAPAAAAFLGGATLGHLAASKLED